LITITSIAELRDITDRARRDGRSIGLVPTMGSLHVGHRSLVRAARAVDDVVVLTIFVNSLQFGPNEDFDAYPRDLAADAEVAEADGVDVLFAPPVVEMYPDRMRTAVHVAELTEGLCGESRPTHFDGVTTIVAKLFSIVGPCRAYFGRKDFQQLVVVGRMARDLDFPVEVVGCPLVREPDGLARSSRNGYLSAEERRAAGVLSKALFWASETIVHGERDVDALVETIRRVVAMEPSVHLEYVEVRTTDHLARVKVLDGEVLVAVAARVGSTRLIDNVTVTLGTEGVTADLGVVAYGP
jgi:pantoate--beta-alanine ligase